MKKTIPKKILTVIVLTVITTLCLTGCSKLETYAVEDFSIKLPEGLEQSTHELSVDVDALLTSDDITLLAINETRTDDAANFTSSLESHAEFAHYVDQTRTECGELKNRNGYYYYSRITQNENIRLVCMYKHNEEFWMFILSVKSDDYDMDDALKWMDSVEFK